MSGFRASFMAEISDLVRHPLAWLAALATAGTAIAVGLSPTTDNTNGWLVYEAALSASSQAAGFFLLGIAAMAVATDRTRGTIRWIMPRPISRAGYVLGKSLAVLLFAVDLLVVATLASWAVAAPHGFDDVVAITEEDAGGDEGFGFVEDEVIPLEFQAASMRSYALGATARLLPALWTLAAIGLLVSTLIRSSAGAVIAAIGISLPVHFLPELLGLTEKTARLLPQRAATASFAQFEIFAKRQADYNWQEYSGASLVAALVLCLGLPLLGALLFRRLDLTD